MSRKKSQQPICPNVRGCVHCVLHDSCSHEIDRCMDSPSCEECAECKAFQAPEFVRASELVMARG